MDNASPLVLSRSSDHQPSCSAVTSGSTELLGTSSGAEVRRTRSEVAEACTVHQPAALYQLRRERRHLHMFGHPGLSVAASTGHNMRSDSLSFLLSSRDAHCQSALGIACSRP